MLRLMLQGSNFDECERVESLQLERATTGWKSILKHRYAVRDRVVGLEQDINPFAMLQHELAARALQCRLACTAETSSLLRTPAESGRLDLILEVMSASVLIQVHRGYGVRTVDGATWCENLQPHMRTLESPIKSSSLRLGLNRKEI
jgi:hypothetical protein